MKELLLAVCMHTTLACEEISLTERLMAAEEAQAYMTISGRLGIFYDPLKTKDYTEYKILGMMVHEVAHMVVWQERPRYGDHGWPFRKVCFDLARKVKVRKSNCEKYT